MEIKEVKELASKLMFEITDDEAEKIINDFKVFEKELDILNDINTDGVEEMIYPFDTKTSFLREDVVNHTLSKDDVLKNVTKVKEGHIVVPKVVK